MARNFLFDWVAPFYDRLLRPANSDRLRNLFAAAHRWLAPGRRRRHWTRFPCSLARKWVP